MAFLNKTGVEHLWLHIVSCLNCKVDRIDGKGLSTNDFTTKEKESLRNLTETYASKDYVDNKLASIGIVAHTHTKAEIIDLEDLTIFVTDDNNGNVTLSGISSVSTY